jgi:hypothetical protein
MSELKDTNKVEQTSSPFLEATEDPEDLQELVIDEPQENINARIDGFFNNLKSWFYKMCSISSKSYDRIIAASEHPAECIAVYMHLVRTARWQKTNSVWAKNVYIKNGLKLGDRKVKRAKAELHTLGLIGYKQNRNKKGQLEPAYIVIKYLPTFKGFSTGGSKSTPPDEQTFEEKNVIPDIKQLSTGGSITAPPVNRTTGKCKQMLKEENKMLKENNNKGENENPVVVLDFQSVLKKYREHGLAFTEKTIRQHYKVCGPEKIADCLRVFAEKDLNKIDKTPEAYFMGILKNYIPGVEITPGHIVQEQNTKKILNDMEKTGEEIKKNKLTPEQTQNLIAGVKNH